MEVFMNSETMPIGQQHGARRLIAAFNARENIRKVFAVAAEGFNSGNHDPFMGVVSTGISIAAGLGKSGFCKLTGHAAGLLDDFAYSIDLGAAINKRETAKQDRLIEILIRTLEKVQALNPPKISFGRAETAAPAPAEPIPVRVVGLPARKITSEIGRNEAGEIVSSMQVEKDF